MLQATTVEKTPLTKQLEILTNQILVIAGIALTVSIILGLYRGVQMQELSLSARPSPSRRSPVIVAVAFEALEALGRRELAGGARLQTVRHRAERGPGRRGGLFASGATPAGPVGLRPQDRALREARDWAHRFAHAAVETHVHAYQTVNALKAKLTMIRKLS